MMNYLKVIITECVIIWPVISYNGVIISASYGTMI